MQKISSIHQFNLKIQQILGSHERKRHAYPKITEATFSFPEFDQFFFLNRYQHAKNQVISLICSGDFVLLKILNSDWQGAFWPIFQEQDFYQA